MLFVFARELNINRMTIKKILNQNRIPSISLKLYGCRGRVIYCGNYRVCPSLSGLSDVKGLSIMLLLCLRKEQPTRPLCTPHISYCSTRHKIADRHMLKIFGTCSCNNKHLGIIKCVIYLLIIGSRFRFGLHLCLDMFEIISQQLFFFLLMKRSSSTVPFTQKEYSVV